MYIKVFFSLFVLWMMFSHCKVLIILSFQVPLTDKLAGSCFGLYFTVNWGERNELFQELKNESPWVKYSPHLFLYGPQLRTIFIFLNGWENYKQNFWTIENYFGKEPCLLFLTKIYCCIHDTIEEISGYNSDNKASQA